MIDTSRTNRILSIVLAALTGLLAIGGLLVATQGRQETTTRFAATATRPALALVSTTTSPGPYQRASVPSFPAGFNPLLTDVGPSATSRPRSVIAATSRSISVRNAEQLQAAIASATPGVLISIEDGRYEGTFEATVIATAKNPIVIRQRNRNGAVFVGQTKFALNGEYWVIDGLRFEGTGASVVTISGLGNRLTNSTFVECGDGTSGGSSGLILLDNPAPDGVNDPDGLQRPLIQRSALVDGNSFVRPKNTVIWQNHGLLGNAYVGNTIVGPHGIAEGGESEAIKIGFGFAAEQTNTLIAFNEITRWVGWPYMIGIKSSGVTVLGNVLDGGRLEIRYGDRARIERNIILNGDLMISGPGHLVSGNVVVSTSARDRLGPLVLVGSSSQQNDSGNYDGVTKPKYYRAVTNSEIVGNTFVSLDPQDAGSVFLLGVGESVWTDPPSSNRFTRNLFLRTSGPTMFLGAAGSPPPPDSVLEQRNSWTSNVFMCAQVCSRSQVAVPGVIGTGGNTAADLRTLKQVTAGAKRSDAKAPPTTKPTARPTTKHATSLTTPKAPPSTRST